MAHLAALRRLCLALAQTEETKNFGCQWFRVKGKPFCVNHDSGDQPAIAFKVARTEQGIFLEDPRFFKTPYMHHHGWVSIRVGKTIDWEEIAELIHGSYRLAAPRSLLNHGKKNAARKPVTGKSPPRRPSRAGAGS